MRQALPYKYWYLSICMHNKICGLARNDNHSEDHFINSQWNFGKQISPFGGITQTGARISVGAAIPYSKFMGPTWVPPGAKKTRMGPMLALWTLLSGYGQLLGHVNLRNWYSTDINFQAIFWCICICCCRLLYMHMLLYSLCKVYGLLFKNVLHIKPNRCAPVLEFQFIYHHLSESVIKGEQRQFALELHLLTHINFKIRFGK